MSFYSPVCGSITPNIGGSITAVSDKSGAVTYPEFERTPEQIDNMQQLLLIVERSSSPDWLEVAELHRELGEFDKALACLDHVAAEEQDVASIQRDLITKGLKCPVSYRL